MTDDLTRNDDVNLNGDAGNTVLIGQAAAPIDIAMPGAGATTNVALTKGQTATLNFDATAATPVIEGNNFVLTFDSDGDGSADSRIVFLNLVEESQGADAPVLIIGGVELSAGLLIGQAQALVDGQTLETAAGAGAGPQGGGGSTYSDDFGDVINGLDAQGTIAGTLAEIAALALAADNPDPAEGVFTFTFATTDVVSFIEGGVEGSFVGGFEDWQANQHLGDATATDDPSTPDVDESISPMQIVFTFTPADNEVVDSVDVTALPEGVTLYVGGFEPSNVVFSNVPGFEVGTLPINILGTDIDEVYLKGAEHSDADLSVTATANITDPDSGESAALTFTVTAIIDAAADKPELDILAKEGTVIENAFSDLADWTVLTTAGKLVDINGGNDKLFAFGGDPANVNVSDIETSLGLADGTFEDLRTVQNDNNEGFFDGVAMSGTFEVAAGQTLTLDYEFLVNEVGDHYNDALFIVINGTAFKLSESLEAPNGAVQNFDGENWDESSGGKSFSHTFDQTGEVTISFVLFNEGDSINGVWDPAVILDNLSTEGKLISHDEETPELTTIPVSVTFDDFADGSETHEIILEGVPADWVLDMGETFGAHAGLVSFTSEETDGFVTYTFNITDYVDRLNGVDPVTDTPDGVVGNGSVTIDFAFDPLDWTSQRLDDGSLNEHGPAEVTVTARASETNQSGEDLSDLNDISTTVDTVTVDIQEDVPEVQDATLVHDESYFPQRDADDVWWISSSVGRALYNSGTGSDDVNSIPGLIGFAESEVSVNFFSDGPNQTGDRLDDATVDDTDVGTESLEFKVYDGEISNLTTTAGNAVKLFTDTDNPNIIWGVTETGEAVFAVYLEQPSAGQSTSLTATFVQFQAVHNPDAGTFDEGNHDEATAALDLQIRAIDDEGDASEYSNLSITIQDDGLKAYDEYRTRGRDEIDEHDLLHSASTVVRGRLDIDYGVDGGSVTDIKFDHWYDQEDHNPHGDTLTSGGVDVSFGVAALNGSGKLVLVGTIPDPENQPNGTIDIIQVTINPNNGKYIVELKGPVDNPDLSLENNSNDYDPLSIRFEYTVTDGDGDTDTAKLVIVVEDDEADAHDTYANEDLSEANLLDNDDTNDVVSGTLNIDHNADGIAVVDLWFEGWEDSEDGRPDGAVLKSGGQDVEFGPATTDGAGNLILVGTINGGATEIVTLKVDPTSGEYTVTLQGPVDHPDQSTNGSDPIDPLTLDFGFKVRDGDGDEDEETLSIYIEDSEPVVDSNLNALVQLDDDVLGGHAGGTGDVDPDSENLTGILNFTASVDGVESVLLTGAALPSGSGFSSSVSSDGTVVTISQNINGTPTDVFRVTLTDTTSGAYTVTQLAAVAHAVGVDENNTQFRINYEVTDKDGDSATGSISINVDDDSPLAVADTGIVTEAATLDVAAAAGVLANDNLGADGAVVSGVVAGDGTPVTLGAAVETDYGFLTLSADGSYTYEAKENVTDTDLVDSFTYEITDGDGDTSTAKLDINVTAVTEGGGGGGTDDTLTFVVGSPLDGGDGFDTLAIPGTAGNASLWVTPGGGGITSFDTDLINNIEVIDLTNGSTDYEDFGVFAPNPSLTSTGMLSVQDVIDMTDGGNTLFVLGDGPKDGVNLEAGQSVGSSGDSEIIWTQTATGIAGTEGSTAGHMFNEYSGTGDLGETVKLYVEDDLTVTIFGTV